MQTFRRTGEVQAVQFRAFGNVQEVLDVLAEHGFDRHLSTDGPEQVVRAYVNVTPTRRADLVFTDGDWAVFDGGHLDRVPDDRFTAGHKAK